MIALPGADTDDYEEAEERDDLEGDAHVAAGPPPLLDLLSLGSAIPSKLCRIYIVYWVMSHALIPLSVIVFFFESSLYHVSPTQTNRRRAGDHERTVRGAWAV
jgi:hypothetical protein